MRADPDTQNVDLTHLLGTSVAGRVVLWWPSHYIVEVISPDGKIGPVGRDLRSLEDACRWVRLEVLP